jgi:arylsulfatase A-like enzyme
LSTGTAAQEVPVSAAWKAAFQDAKIALAAPGRGDNGNAGDSTHPGTWVPNLAQQQYFLEAAVNLALPRFAKSGKPFVMVFWSRDPDGTQHNQGDSFHTVDPGINEPTSLAAIRNADFALALIEATLKHLRLYDDTNIVVAADHGFSTIVKTGTDSPSEKGVYKDVKERAAARLSRHRSLHGLEEHEPPPETVLSRRRLSRDRLDEGCASRSGQRTDRGGRRPPASGRELAFDRHR